MSDPDGSKDWARRVSEVLYAYRRWALAFGVLLAGLAVGPVSQIEVANSLRQYIVEEDPALEAYREFQATYGNDETVLVGLQRSSGFLTPDGFSLLRTATERVRQLDDVVGVRSLTTQVRVQHTLVGPRLQPLVPPGSLSSAQAKALREHITADSSLRRFVSEDGTMAALVARMPPSERLTERREAILDSIRHRLRPLDASVHLAGFGVILEALNEATTQDSAVVLVAALLGMVLLLGAFFRRVGPVLVTVAVVGTAALWLMGLYGALGNPVNTVTLVIPTLVLVVGTADCVHLLVHAAHLPDTVSRRERTIQTIAYLLFPCTVTSLTTAAGFSVLTASSIPIVQDLGLFSALGVLGAFVATLIGCANALPYAWSEPHRPRGNGLNAVVERVVGAGFRHWRAIGVGGLVIAGLAVVGVGRLSVDTNSIGYLFADHPVRQDSRLIEEKLGPYAPLEFVVRSDSTVLRPSLLRAVRAWEDRAVASGAVGWHHSAADVLDRLRREVMGSEATLEHPRQLRSLLTLGRSHRPVLEDLAAHPSQLRVTFGLPIQSARGVKEAIATLKQQAAVLPEGATVEATGYLPLYVRMTTLLVEAQLRSFGLALLVIPLGIALLFGGLWAAGWSLVPNLLPVLLTLGAMGWAGIPLDIVTVTIAVIVFGLVVDDTVHLLYRYLKVRRTRARKRALRIGARRAGRMMTITTAVLAGGFLVLALAHNRSVVWFGLLVAGALAAALLVDLLVLPALLAGGERMQENVLDPVGDGYGGPEGD